MQYPNIEAERGRRGMSKTSLASELGVTRDTFAKWQAGKTPIPASAVVKMAKLFDCTADYLLGINSNNRAV